MEYIIVGLIVALFIVLYFKQPARMYSVVVRAVVEDIRKNQTDITQKLYNKLPDEVKKKFTAYEVITILTFMLNIILEVLGESAKKEKSTDSSK